MATYGPDTRKPQKHTCFGKVPRADGLSRHGGGLHVLVGFRVFRLIGFLICTPAFYTYRNCLEKKFLQPFWRDLGLVLVAPSQFFRIFPAILTGVWRYFANIPRIVESDQRLDLNNTDLYPERLTWKHEYPKTPARQPLRACEN